MAHKYNLYFAMIFEKEELDRRGRQVVLYLQFYTDNITASAIFYLLIAVIAKVALYWTDSILLAMEDRNNGSN